VPCFAGFLLNLRAPASLAFDVVEDHVGAGLREKLTAAAPMPREPP